ncbi:MAG: hypothetical protein ACO3LE_04440 [Bdellovibrionota bacterium]
MNFLKEIQLQLQRLNDSRHEFQVMDFLLPTENQNALLINQEGENLDIAICLSSVLLDKFQSKKYPIDFNVESFSELSVIIEELSHFNLFCENAMRNQETSALELELQGEVDKFGFALECLHAQQEQALEDVVFGVLFDELKLGDWVKEQDRGRYIQAHETARAFCRKVMKNTEDMKKRRELFKTFFHSSFTKKINLSS